MRAVVQRVARARVTVGDRVVGEIGPGLAVLVGVARDDTSVEAAWLAAKIADLRIFSDEDGKMNRPLLDSGGDALVVSQFTLYGDVRKGRRPSFVAAARGPEAEALFDEVVAHLAARGIRCETGEFGAMMDVELVNRGPVTILLETPPRREG